MAHCWSTYGKSLQCLCWCKPGFLVGRSMKWLISMNSVINHSRLFGCKLLVRLRLCVCVCMFNYFVSSFLTCVFVCVVREHPAATRQSHLGVHKWKLYLESLTWCADKHGRKSVWSQSRRWMTRGNAGLHPRTRPTQATGPRGQLTPATVFSVHRRGR